MCWYVQNQYACGHNGKLQFRRDEKHSSECDKDDNLEIRPYRWKTVCRACEEERKKLAAMQSSMPNANRDARPTSAKSNSSSILSRGAVSAGGKSDKARRISDGSAASKEKDNRCVVQ